MSSLTASGPMIAESSVARVPAVVGDLLRLTRPRIAVMILVAVGASCFVAAWGAPDAGLLWSAVLGTGLVAASSSAANQWLERDTDALMRRTARRPIPARRLAARHVFPFVALTGAGGLAWLAGAAGWSPAGWAALSWLLYVGAYTPLKRYSPWSTGIGAVAGALPVVVAWTAVGAPLGWRCGALFTWMFLWQFPHFMAVAWIHRDDYARAGLRMMTVVDRSGVQAGVHAVLGSVAMIPVTLAPAIMVRTQGGAWIAAAAIVLGGLMLGASFHFLFQRTLRSARLLLRVSLVYLPLMFALLALTTVLGSWR